MRSDLRIAKRGALVLLALSTGCSFDWDGLRPNGTMVTPDVTTDTVRTDATDESRTDVVTDRGPTDVVINDAPDASDVADASDVTDASDAMDVADVTDVADARDASDVTDAMDVADAMDVTDATDVTDVSDVADVRDASDVTDASDVVDVTDAPVDTSPTCTGAAMTCPCSPTNAGGYCRPGESCTAGACVAGTVAGSLVITEIMSDPAVPIADETGEWFEIYNPGATPFDLRGMRISNVRMQSATIDASTPVVIGPRAFAVLGRNSTASLNGGVTVLYAYAPNPMSTAVVFSNGSVDAVIIDMGGSSSEIDRVLYDPTSSSWPHATGKSKNLRPTVLDYLGNDNPMNWCNAPTQWTPPSSDYGSPGVANPACP